MPEHNPTIIADRFSDGAARRIAVIVGLAALVLGSAAAVHYARLGLTLSHYDARAHLVVARRVTDSLTPGWRQIGGVWLPLPHLLDLLPIQFDWSYRTGYPAVGLSVVSLSCGLAALAAYLFRRTGSFAAAAAGPLVVLANPNLLYLQSTPMTEPLLLALGFGGLLAVDRWLEDPTPRATAMAGAVLAALVLTRYEGWCVAAALLAVSGASQARRGARHAFALVPYVAGAVLAFMALSRASTGSFFVDTGFFVADNPARHSLAAALDEVSTGTRALGGTAVLIVALGECAMLAVAFVRRRPEGLALCLLAAAALPTLAFFDGHPFRVRYMVSLVAVAGMLAARAVARLPRPAHVAAASMLVLAAVAERPPFDPRAPMVVEAQWETPYRLGRVAVTRYLTQAYDGTPILASMGSLGHYMQESSQSGLNIADFLHEGNGDLWAAALAAPSHYVRWMLIEERAEGGDQLAAKARSDSGFLRGFARVAEGGGLALYRNVCAPASIGCTARASAHVP